MTTTTTSLKEQIMIQAVAAKASGKGLTFFAARYAYVGIPVEIHEDYIVLDGAALPFETGEFSSNQWTRLEKFPSGTWTIMMAAIESFGKMK